MSFHQWQHISNILLLVLGIFLSGCGATHHVRPLAVGDSELYLSVGGPIVIQGVPFPAPYSVFGYAWGAADRWTVHADIHPSAALYKTLAGSAGALFGIAKQHHFWPELAIDFNGIAASDFDEAVFFPMATLIGSYEIAEKRWLLYGGLDAIWQFHDNDDVFLPRSYAPLLGARYQGSNNNLLVIPGIEIKWLGISDEIDASTLDFPKPFGSDYGDLGIFFSFNYRFDRRLQRNPS